MGSTHMMLRFIYILVEIILVLTIAESNFLVHLDETTTNQPKFNNCTFHTHCTEDGYFKEGICQSTFCQCWEGEGTLDECRDPLKFDETIAACAWPDQIEECQGTQPTEPGTTAGDIDCDSLCGGHDTGDLVNDGCCTARYCWCGGDGQGWLTDCTPPGNLFCQASQECLEADNCLSTDSCCDQMPTTDSTVTSTIITPTTTSSTTTTIMIKTTTTKRTTTSTTTLATTETTELTKPTTTTTITTEKTTSEPEDLDCEAMCKGAPNGNKGSCCSSRFCMCFDGVGYENSCMTGQGLCFVTGSCQEDCDFDAACCEKPSTLSSTSTSTVKSTTLPDCNLVCQDKPGGNIGTCCSSNYCMCYSGAGYLDTCASGEGFCQGADGCVKNCDQDSSCCF